MKSLWKMRKKNNGLKRFEDQKKLFSKKEPKKINKEIIKKLLQSMLQIKNKQKQEYKENKLINYYTLVSYDLNSFQGI